ncbi:hypothetical protein E2C01_003144 [Portunus trituberculatus]|uniref:Uncharacterized protein n=1 Tax=Portunus trituberculatus TaxID=210409 RepID=A0A5B7CLL2_PORTR|nr:hypothetical protein [Portunus trituberculatus]
MRGATTSSLPYLRSPSTLVNGVNLHCTGPAREEGGGVVADVCYEQTYIKEIEIKYRKLSHNTRDETQGLWRTTCKNRSNDHYCNNRYHYHCKKYHCNKHQGTEQSSLDIRLNNTHQHHHYKPLRVAPPPSTTTLKSIALHALPPPQQQTSQSA